MLLPFDLAWSKENSSFSEANFFSGLINGSIKPKNLLLAVLPNLKNTIKNITNIQAITIVGIISENNEPISNQFTSSIPQAERMSDAAVTPSFKRSILSAIDANKGSCVTIKTEIPSFLQRS